MGRIYYEHTCTDYIHHMRYDNRSFDSWPDWEEDEVTDKQYFAKCWLNQIYIVTKRELAAKEEVQARILASITSGAVDYSKDRIQNNNPQGQENRVITYAQATDDVEKVREKIARLIRVRLEVINMIPDSVLRTLLIERYINQKSWGWIETALVYSHQRMMELHLKALAAVADLIPTGDDEI